MKSFLHIPVICLLLVLYACGSKNTESHIPELPDNFDQSVQLRIDYLTGLIKDDDDNPSNFYQRARLYLQQDEISAAIEDIREAIKLQSDKAEFHFVLGKCYQKIKNYRAATEALKDAEQLGYSTPELFIALGECLVGQKHFSEGLYYLDQGLGYFPKDPAIYYHKALALFDQKDTMAAIHNFNQSIGADSGYFDSYHELFNLYLSRKDAKMALYYNALAIKHSKNPAAAYTDKAVYFQSTGHKDSTAYAYQQALAADSLNPAIRYKLAEAFLYLQRYAEAEQALKTILENAPDPIMANYYLGVALHFQGKYEEALPYYALVPYGHDKYKYAQRFIEKLRFLESGGQTTRADSLRRDSL